MYSIPFLPHCSNDHDVSSDITNMFVHPTRSPCMYLLPPLYLASRDLSLRSKGKSDSNPPSACAAKQLKALVPQRVALVPETAVGHGRRASPN